MAPLVGASDPVGNNSNVFLVHASPANHTGPDLIEIDDEEDELMNSDAVEEEESEEEEEEADESGADDESEGSSEFEVNKSETVFMPPKLASDTALNTLQFFTSVGAQQALHPLRRTADRVTRQIEEFAEKLDRFKQKEARPLEFESFQAAYQLVQNYHDLTQNAVNDLRRHRSLNRAKRGWGVNGDAKITLPDAADKRIEEELTRLELERETWELLLNLISVDDPHTRARSAAAQKSAFQTLHRYSSDRQIWEQFLDADHYALECTVILKWLEGTAKHGMQEINSLIEDLERRAARGEGVWSHGWLYTKEAIKGQKRLRAWPQPLEPNSPGITVSLVNSETRDPLVTQLDPDAVTRQRQSLQKEDKFYERSTWATCWRMLRQGESWTTIREWSQEHLESWRAVSLCGSSIDTSFCGEVKTPVDDSTTRMMNFRLQNSWRTSCLALARNADIDDFQRAVYALLSGEIQPAFNACRSWDDYVYVHLNSVVIARYQGFCKQLQRKINHSPTTPVVFIPEPTGSGELLHFLQHLRSNESIGAEARNPYRTMQAAIMSKAYDKLFHASARSISRSAAGSPERSLLIPDLSPYQADEIILMAANDQDALRIASHLYVIVRSMGYTRIDTQSVEIASVNVVGYIAALEEAGVYNPIPLYASLLPVRLRNSVLGKILIAVVDTRERRKQVKLMEKYGIDVEAVLQTQWEWVWHRVSAIDRPRTVKRSTRVFIGPGGNKELTSVRRDYIGNDISLDDEQIIRSLEWLRYIDGQWGKICRLGALSYRRFYISGKLAAARELSRRMRLSDISLSAFGFDVTESLFQTAEGREAGAPEPQSPATPRALGVAHELRRSSLINGVPAGNEQSILFQQSQSMRDLEQLIVSFDALERYATYYHQLAKSRRGRDSSAMKQLVDEVRQSLSDASHEVDKILDECLTGGTDETEQAELEEIRNTYIPELFLEYHNVLYSAGYTFSSQYLAHCMNLAVQISESEHLTRSFSRSRRMAELVDALAISSRALVKLGATREPVLPGGETPGIWYVESAGKRDDEFHDFVREARENGGRS